jgi:hypothetical protein
MHTPLVLIRSVPRRIATVLIVVLAAGMSFAGPLAGPAHAATPPFSNVQVVNGSTSVKISFDAPLALAPRVTVGTGLDPLTSAVAQKQLSYRASHHYSTTMKGLKPTTGYSFRLDWTYDSYVDITSIVTLPAPMQFTNVKASVKYVSATVAFDFPGPGPVTLTISKSLDFQQYFKKLVVNSPNASGRWSITATQLDANTGYAFQLTAANTPYYTDITSLVTPRRDVVLHYYTAKIVDDGDAFPFGCGDFALTHRDIAGGQDTTYFQTMIVGECLYSGDTFNLVPTGLSDREFDDQRATSSFRTEFYAWDDDRDGTDWDCVATFVDYNCGDLGYGVTYIDISKPGTHKFKVHSLGAINSVDVWAYGDVVVTYS